MILETPTWVPPEAQVCNEDKISIKANLLLGICAPKPDMIGRGGGQLTRVPARTLTCEAEKSTEQWAAVMTVLALTKTPPQK